MADPTQEMLEDAYGPDTVSTADFLGRMPPTRYLENPRPTYGVGSPTDLARQYLGPVREALAPVGEAISGGMPSHALEAMAGFAGPRIGNPIRAWQGSPYDHSGWDPSFIGKGQGARTFFEGHYFADEPKVAKDYRKQLSSKPDTFTEYSVKQPSGEVLKIPGGTGDYTFQSQPGGGREGIAPELHHAANMTAWDGLRSSRAAARRWVEEAQSSPQGMPHGPEYYQRLYDYLKGFRPGDVSVNKGRLFEVDLHVPEWLDWDLPMAKQDPAVRSKMIDFAAQRAQELNDTRETRLQRGTDAFGRPLREYQLEGLLKKADPELMTGEQIYKQLQQKYGAMREGDKEAMGKASQYLSDLGILGGRYLDEKSRQYLGHDYDISLRQWQDELARVRQTPGDHPGPIAHAQDKIAFFKKKLQEANKATWNRVVFPGAEDRIELIGKHRWGGRI